MGTVAPTVFPPVWMLPRVPQDSKDKIFLDQLLSVLNDLTTTLAVQLNDEALKNSGTQLMYGDLDLSKSTGFTLPVIAGDWASPASGEVWFNTTLDRFRGKTASLPAYSLAMYRVLATNVALGNGIGSVNVTMNPVEPDTAYIVGVETTWSTTVYITNKIVGSFTINFATVTPNTSQHVSYWLVR